MVSKASDDLPEPDTPVNTTSASRGSSRSTFFRLCSRAPRTWIVLCGSAAVGLLTILAMRFGSGVAPGAPSRQRRGALARRPPSDQRRHADILVDLRPVNALSLGDQAPSAALLGRSHGPNADTTPEAPRHCARGKAPQSACRL